MVNHFVSLLILCGILGLSYRGKAATATRAVLLCPISVGVVLLFTWPCRGVLWMQKLKTRLLTTQSSKVLPCKPGVGPYIAIYATLTAGGFFVC